MPEYPESAKETGDSLVSIIVPVYKVEKYLNRCVDSILAQTYRNFELILVDDGSPDDCGRICDEYAEADPRIRVLHQKNQGQAAARNHAVQVCNGEYIIFVDSDDYVTEDHVEYLFGLLQKYQADVSIGDFYYVYEGSSPKIKDIVAKDEKLDTVEALQQLGYTRGFGSYPWAKLYRKDLILAHPFPEGRIYEDLAVLYQIIGDSGVIAFGNRKIYYWLQRAGSTMHSAFDERQLFALEATRAQLAYMEERYPKVVPAAKARHMAKIVELMPLVLKSTNAKENYRRLKKEMTFYAEVMKDRQVKKSQKYRLTAMRLGYYPAKLAFSIHEQIKRKKYYG